VRRGAAGRAVVSPPPSGREGARARRIVSRENPLFRELAQLAASSRERRRQGASLLEGVHLCQAWLDRHGPPPTAIVSETGAAHPEVALLAGRLPAPPVMLSDALFGAISAVEHGVGVAFVVTTPRPALPAAIDHDAVYLDRLQDPGNVGTILRTCAAAGVGRVITAPGTAWCWSPKVLRAGMGAHFHLEIHESVAWAELGPRVRAAVLATRVEGARPLYAADLRPPALWLFGREGEGLSPGLEAAVGTAVTIPQSPAVESLNVGVAAAICLFEQLRQRRFPAAG